MWTCVRNKNMYTSWVEFLSTFFRKNIGPLKTADPNANKQTSVPKGLLPKTFTGKQLQHKARNTEWKNRKREGDEKGLHHFSLQLERSVNYFSVMDAHSSTSHFSLPCSKTLKELNIWPLIYVSGSSGEKVYSIQAILSPKVRTYPSYKN